MPARKPVIASAAVGFLLLAGSSAAAASVGSSPAGGSPAKPSQVPGNGISRSPDVTTGGRFVVFSSTSTDLVPGDTNRKEDIFIRDTSFKKTRLVSKGMRKAPSNGNSVNPVVSEDGRYVFFASDASNLVPGDTNRASDIFKTDMTTGVTTRVSVSKTGAQGNAASKRPQINSSGTVLAFASSARNLVPGDTNKVQDIFVRGTANNSLKRASTTPSGAQLSVGSYSPSVSFDGKIIGWQSDPFADPAVTNTCGRVTDALGVISKTAPAPTARPTITEVVCRDSARSHIYQVRANNRGVGYALMSDDGYGAFLARGQENTEYYDYSVPDSYTTPSWDVGRWGTVLASTHSASSEIQIHDQYGWEKTLNWQSTDLSMSPDGATVAFQYVPTGEIYIWNWQNGTNPVNVSNP